MASHMKASILVQLLDQATGPANRIAASLRGIEKAAQRAERAGRGRPNGMRAQAKASEGLGAGLRRATVGAEALAAQERRLNLGPASSAMRVQARFGHSLGTTLGTTATSVAALATQQQRLTRSTEVATRAVERQRRVTRRGHGAASRLDHRDRRSVGTRAVENAQERASSTIMGGTRGAIGATVGVLAVGSAIRRTTGEAISFEKAFAEVRKKINDAPSPEAFGDIEREIKRTSKDLGIPQNEVAALTAEAGASGIAFNDLGRFIKLAAKASVGWDMPAAEASQKLAEIKAGTGMTIGELETLSDKINALGDNSAAKERNIVEMFHRSAAAAKEAGVSFDTSLATLTAVNSAGMQPEIAARWFNAFSGGLRTASEDNDSMVAGLKILGLTAKGVSDGMKRDSGKTMLDVFDRLGKSAEAAEAATKIFGKGWWDETLRAKSAGGELRKQLEMLKNPGNYVGSLDKGLNIQLDTTAKHLERLSSLATDVGDRMGRWSLPPINDRIEKVLKQYDELEKRFKVKAAGEGTETPGDPIGRLVTKGFEVGGKLYDAALDRLIAPLPTDDPARKAQARNAEEDRDKRALAEKKRAEATTYDEQAKRAPKADRPLLQERAAKARTEAAQAETQALDARRASAAAGARDMSNTETGEAYAKRSIELEKRAREIEGALAANGSKSANVRIPGTGIIEAREAIQAELEKIRTELTSAKTETTPAAELPSMNAPLPPPRPASVDRGKPVEVALPEQAVTAAPQARAVPLPPPRPPELGGAKIEVDKSQLDAIKPAADAAKESLSGISDITVAPKGDTAGLKAITAEANAAAAALQRVISLSGQAKAGIGAVNAAGGSGPNFGSAARGLDRSRQTSMESSPT